MTVSQPKIKFGTKVSIVKRPFYNGIKGVILAYSQADQQYTVKLDHGVMAAFFEYELKKVGR